MKRSVDKESMAATELRRGVGAAALASSIVMVAMMVVMALAAPSAHAAFGDQFGIAPINDGAGPGQEVPGLADVSHAFWAGTCQRATAPPGGAAIPGGIGVMSGTVVVPSGVASSQTTAPAPATTAHCIDRGGLGIPSVHPGVWSQPPSWRLGADTQAGGHPDGSALTYFTRPTDGGGTVDNIQVELPAGFVGDPTAVPQCTAEQFAVKPSRCPPQSQVGVVYLYLAGAVESTYQFKSHEEILPVYNLEPRLGNVAELGFPWASGEDVVAVRVVAKARTNGDFGVTTFVGQIPAPLPFYGQTITLWGVPWAASNDVWRPTPESIEKVGVGSGGAIALTGVPTQDRVSYHPSWGAIRPFLTNVTGPCDGQTLLTKLATDQYLRPGAFTADGDPDPTDADWKRYEAPAPAITGCEKNPFAPAADFVPTSTGADSASGLNVSIDIPQNEAVPPAVATNPSDSTGAPAYWRTDAGVATAHLDKTVVTLSEGMSVNPSSATGLAGCSDSQMGVTAVGNPYKFNNAEPACPDGSKIGTVEAKTPLLEEKLSGEVILGTPKSIDPQSGEMLRLFLVLRNEDRGLLAKIYGSTKADPNTGQLTATFDKNPRVPVENIKVSIKGGDRGVLAMPQACSTEPDEYQSVSSFTPWSRAHLPEADRDPVDITQNWVVDQNCAYGFSPGLKAGMSNPAARKSGTFSFEFTRPQGDQVLRSLTAELPAGLLASVKGLPLCSNAQANAGNCPAASRIGLVDASAGSGDPFVLETKGDVYLTEGYKGGPYGLMVKVRAIAGPFRGAMELSPIIVRQKIEIDPTTAQVRAISDPFPTVWHGVPLRVRRVLVNVDRPDFMVNPSDCSPKQVTATLTSGEGAAAGLSNPYQATGCAALPFKPKLALRLTGRKQIRTGRHPGVRAQVNQKGIGEAGIERAEVRLPKSLALDVDNAQALCEFEDGTKPDLENHCPKGSIVGRARAATPLLDAPLAGNVYFVKNVRIDPKTGNRIRTLPMIVVALRGEIAINLVGESSTTKAGNLVNTFDEVPDAPVSRFNLNINGGRNGILAVTRTRKAKINLCAGRHVAEADMDGQNGRRHDFDVRMKTPCTKAQSKAAKRKARRLSKD